MEHEGKIEASLQVLTSRKSALREALPAALTALNMANAKILG